MYDPKKPRILVALGGKSSERGVSIETGKSVAAALEKLGYPVGIIDIGTGTLMQTPELDNIPKDATKLPSVSNIPLVDIKRHFEMVFIAMHGAFGEDGGLQSLLDYSGIAYTGSGALACALSMDKKHSKTVLKANGVPVLDHQIITKAEDKITIPFPVIVKPNNQGSSVGVSICENDSDALVGAKLALKYSDEAMVEPLVKGKELTVLVIEEKDGNPKALPVIEIIPPQNHKFFDFVVKYDGSTQEVCPAEISPDLTKKAQELARNSYQAIGCRHFARVDMMVDKDENVFVLEVNSIPGLTAESLSPKATKAAGMSYEDFIDHIVQTALQSSKSQIENPK